MGKHSNQVFVLVTPEDISQQSDFCIARSNGKFSILILLIRLFDRNDHSLFPETASSVVSGTPLAPGYPSSLATPSSLRFDSSLLHVMLHATAPLIPMAKD